MNECLTRGQVNLFNQGCPESKHYANNSNSLIFAVCVLFQQIFMSGSTRLSPQSSNMYWKAFHRNRLFKESGHSCMALKRSLLHVREYVFLFICWFGSLSLLSSKRHCCCVRGEVETMWWEIFLIRVIYCLFLEVFVLLRILQCPRC